MTRSLAHGGRQLLPALIGPVLFLAALGVLRTELRTLSWQVLIADVLATPRWRLGVALLLTILNYAVLTGYDFLALASIGKRLPWLNVAATSFLSYAIANNVGLGMLSGASVRYRFYTRWGVTAEELTRIVVSYSVTFWLGLLALGGVVLALHPFPAGHGFPDGRVVAPLGWLLMAASAAYLAATMVRRTPIHVGGLDLSLPPPRLAVAQLLVSTLEWTLAGAVMYALLPPSQLSFLAFAGAFLAAILIGLVSHVPGGVGVFEGLMVLLLKPYFTSSELLPSLITYRAVYYLLPLAMAVVALAVDEARQRRGQIARLGGTFVPLGRLVEQVTPRALSIVTFLGGVLLLVSGATPAAPGRLSALHGALPLAVIEISHFIGSIVGAALLVLSHGLKRRLDAAYFLAVIAVAIGIAVSLLKGVDYEEATLLTGVLLILWWARPAFDRRAAFFETRFSAAWVVAVAGAVGASMWLGMFAFRHVEYSRELWWQFELHAEASRFLRASVGVATGLLLVAMARLLGPVPHELVPPDSADLEAARVIIAAHGSTAANLVFLRDKAILFDEDRTGFVMYGVQGRTWVALGDPVCPPDRVRGLIQRFLERCGDFAGVPVFYEIGTEHLHHYVDLGLTFAKVGEEARVDLTAFTLDGARAAKYRQVMRRLDKDGGSFRIIPAADVPAVIGQLRAVSDDWLHLKSAAEKGFSLGFFDVEYLLRFPVAVIERSGRIEAFANLWLEEEKVTLSLDLMRYRHDAPRDAMEALFVHMMRWGKERGYRWFTLGMAPLSGFEIAPVATLWNRLGGLLYRHGEVFYNFQGLRAYKQKFDPVWTPRYLAYPGGLRLPRVLVDVSVLIAGGYRSIFAPPVESGIRNLELGMRERIPTS